MKIATYFICMVALAVPVNAVDFSSMQSMNAADIAIAPSAVDSILVPAHPSQTVLSILPKTRLDNRVIPGFPERTEEELFVKGGLSFSLKSASGETILCVLKLGFQKGHYDDYVQNYKTKPVLIFSLPDFTDGLSESMYTRVYDLIEGDVHSTSVEMNENEKIFISVLDKSVSISLHNKKNADTGMIAETTINALRKAWADNAERYAAQYNGQKIYLVQQELHIWIEDWHGFGFVMSKGTPFFHTTSLPLDVVELSRYYYADDATVFKPVAYSIPMDLALEKRQEGGWTLRGIKSEEFNAALDDEAMDTASRWAAPL